MTAVSAQRAGSQLHCLVLVLDDHEDTRQMYATFLTDEGLTIESNVAPQQAIEWVRREQPDVVVTDYLMPGVDGLEFCQQLAAHPDTRHIPRILLTGVTSEAELAPLRQLCGAVLLKPVLPAELAAEISKATHYECGRAATA
jgi:CheY-like chemotaxis protein